MVLVMDYWNTVERRMALYNQKTFDVSYASQEITFRYCKLTCFIEYITLLHFTFPSSKAVLGLPYHNPM